jgi:hypothetical protein
MCEFYLDYFNGLLWQWINFNTYLLPESQRITFKVTLIANGQNWATEVMKGCDEALNASSLQFLCQR